MTFDWSPAYITAALITQCALVSLLAWWGTGFLLRMLRVPARMAVWLSLLPVAAVLVQGSVLALDLLGRDALTLRGSVADMKGMLHLGLGFSESWGPVAVARTALESDAGMQPGALKVWLEWQRGCAIAVAVALGLIALRAAALIWATARNTRALRSLESLGSRVTLFECPVPIVLVPGALAPCLIGIRNQRLLIGEEAMAALSPNELRAVLLHEVRHVARRDTRTSLALHMLNLVFGWLPGVALALRRARTSMEIDCDAWAVARGARAADLASALVTLQHCRGPQPLAGVRFMRVCSLRVQALTQHHAGTPAWQWPLRVLAGVGLMWLLVGMHISIW